MTKQQPSPERETLSPALREQREALYQSVYYFLPREAVVDFACRLDRLLSLAYAEGRQAGAQEATAAAYGHDPKRATSQDPQEPQR